MSAGDWITEPQIESVNVHYGGGGKIAIVDYGKHGSDYSYSLSRRYAMPPDWTEEQVADFEREKIAMIQGVIDPLIQADQDMRLEVANWNK